MSTTDAMPSAEIVFDTLFAYQKSAALKTAIDLELFTAIDDGAHTAAAIATRINVSERGARILCDYLTVNRLLAKSDGAYHLVPESAAFLSKRSPAYLGTVADFLLRPELKNNFENLTEAVRRRPWWAWRASCAPCTRRMTVYGRPFVSMKMREM